MGAVGAAIAVGAADAADAALYLPIWKQLAEYVLQEVVLFDVGGMIDLSDGLCLGAK